MGREEGEWEGGGGKDRRRERSEGKPRLLLSSRSEISPTL